MKEASLEELKSNAQALLEAAQSERILITDGGKPVPFLVGVEHKDEEDAFYESSPEFWRMIEERRKSPTRRLRHVEAKLFHE